MDRTRSLGTVAGVLRAGIGGAVALAPGTAARAWVGPTAELGTGTAFVRAVGVRDVALGAAILRSRGSRRDTAAMVRLGALADLGDAAATLLVAPRLDRRRRVLVPVVAGVAGLVALVGAALASSWDEAATRPETPGEIRATIVERDVDLRAERTRT